jgi:large subunit ribosomal protein L25
MPDNTLVAQPGRATGSAAARRLRAEGNIPGVLYGHGMTPVSLSVNRRELRHAIAGPAGLNTLLDLSVEGTTYPAIIKDIQRHPIKRTVSHIDFQQVSLNEEITISVPVHLHGEARAVLNEGGFVDPAVDTIDVVTTPRNMPSEIVIDISEMQLGDVIRLSDVSLPSGVTAAGDPDLLIVSTMAGTTEADTIAEGEAAAEGEAGAEGEGGEAAETGEAAGDAGE